jgi:hypothetical protein
MTNAPPPSLDYARVIAYAIVDHTVQWTDRQRLYVGEELLGPVPGLAIGQNLFEDGNDFLLLHCDEDWNVLGVLPRPSIPQIKEAAERWYRGIEARWTAVENTAEAAENWIRAQETTVTCSFCDKLPPQVESVAFGNGACICNECTRRLYEDLINNGRGDSAA